LFLYVNGNLLYESFRCHMLTTQKSQCSLFWM
jgi:hypothetical protein